MISWRKHTGSQGLKETLNSLKNTISELSLNITYYEHGAFEYCNIHPAIMPAAEQNDDHNDLFERDYKGREIRRQILYDEILTYRRKGSCGEPRDINVRISSVSKDSAVIVPHKGLFP